MRNILLLTLLVFGFNSFGQIDSTSFGLKLTGDFRFRIEHDWNSQNSSGVLRNDRSRLRYRFRFGLNYVLDKNSSFGGRLRSGNINDQQGPHLTLGGNEGEFGLTKIGLEKLFYQFQNKNLKAWVGKNTIPLLKLNELFWNDNVFPEGVGLKYKLKLKKKSIQSLGFNAGHFIINSNNQTFNKDSYFQFFQIESNLLNNRISLFPALYYFNKIGNIPDGKHSHQLDYTILHLGSLFKITKDSKLKLGLEYYLNLEDYAKNDSIHLDLRDQKKGFVISAKYGDVKEKGNWLIHLYYANLEKFSIVDYFAQNDWARWDYSSANAAGSRISNFQGVELRVGYAVKKKFTLILRSYLVEELINIGDFKENGSRVRLDLNIGF